MSSNTKANSAMKKMASIEAKYGTEKGRKFVTFLLGYAGIPWATVVKGNPAIATYLNGNTQKLDKLTECIKNKCFVTRFETTKQMYPYSTP